VKRAGLHLSAFKCLPASLVTSALSDQPEGKAALDLMSRIITDAGKLGVPALGYRWLPVDSGDVSNSTPARGGALSTVYRLQVVSGAGRQDRRAALWQRLAEFLRHVVPVAEAAGVRLAYLTDLALAALPEDARILDRVSELDHLFQVASSPYHGLDLDHGIVTQVLAPQAGMTPSAVIRRFGDENRIFAVGLRSVRATDGGAQDCFLDEDRAAVLSAVQAYRDARFEGPLAPLSPPVMTDDTDWQHKGAAFSIGYLRAVLQALG
jgi:mannonate dehydratase